MKIRTSTFICIVMITSTCFSHNDRGSNLDSSSSTRFLGFEKAANFLTILSYWPSVIKACEQAIKNNSIHPEIQCGKCLTKVLSLGEFSGGLIGKSLKDLVDGKDNFAASKKILDDCLLMIQTGFHKDITDFMLRVANEVKISCSHCETSDSCCWVLCCVNYDKKSYPEEPEEKEESKEANKITHKSL